MLPAAGRGARAPAAPLHARPSRLFQRGLRRISRVCLTARHPPPPPRKNDEDHRPPVSARSLLLGGACDIRRSTSSMPNVFAVYPRTSSSSPLFLDARVLLDLPNVHERAVPGLRGYRGAGGGFSLSLSPPSSFVSRRSRCRRPPPPRDKREPRRARACGAPGTGARLPTKVRFFQSFRSFISPPKPPPKSATTTTTTAATPLFNFSFLQKIRHCSNSSPGVIRPSASRGGAGKKKKNKKKYKKTAAAGGRHHPATSVCGCIV